MLACLGESRVVTLYTGCAMIGSATRGKEGGKVGECEEARVGGSEERKGGREDKSARR